MHAGPHVWGWLTSVRKGSLHSFAEDVWIATVGGDGRCTLCQLWPVSHGPITCKVCLSHRRKRHDFFASWFHTWLCQWSLSWACFIGFVFVFFYPGLMASRFHMYFLGAMLVCVILIRGGNPTKPLPNPGADDAHRVGDVHSIIFWTHGPTVWSKHSFTNLVTPLPSQPFGPDFDPTSSYRPNRTRDVQHRTWCGAWRTTPHVSRETARFTKYQFGIAWVRRGAALRQKFENLLQEVVATWQCFTCCGCNNATVLWVNHYKRWTVGSIVQQSSRTAIQEGWLWIVGGNFRVGHVFPKWVGWCAIKSSHL